MCVHDDASIAWPKLRVLARSSPADKYALVTGIQASKLTFMGTSTVEAQAPPPTSAVSDVERDGTFTSAAAAVVEAGDTSVDPVEETAAARVGDVVTPAAAVTEVGWLHVDLV